MERTDQPANQPTPEERVLGLRVEADLDYAEAETRRQAQSNRDDANLRGGAA